MNHLIYIIILLLVLYLLRNNIEKFNNNLTISICIPCIPRDLDKLPKTLDSINNQTILPLEVIIGLSETSDEYATHLENNLNKYKFPIKIYNTIDKAYAGPNRNRAAKHAKGELISFMDADDIMHHKKLELVSKVYNKLKPKCIVHSYTSKIKNFNLRKANRILKGKMLHKLANRQIENKATNDWYTKNNKLHNWISLNRYGKIHHGHPTIHRSVLNDVKYCNKPRGQDAVFLRNLLKFYKNKDETIVWINQPLSYYIPSKIQNLF